MSSLLCFLCDLDTQETDKDGNDLTVHHNFFKKYNVLEKLGEGGYAVVNRATRKSDGKEVAVKISKREGMRKKDEEALHQEYNILKGLHHSNIVEALDLFEEKNHFYVVMEYLKGGELFDRIVKKTQYNEREARDTVVRILSAIQHMHQHDVVHRDLKPENLLMTNPNDDSAVKIADFGLSKVAKGFTITDRSGTPNYVAPEMIANQPYGKPVDMWAFGVILFILIGGYPPFQANNNHQLFSKISKAKFVFHKERWANVSKEAKDLICKILVANPEKRLTASQAMAHEWIHMENHTLDSIDLNDNLGQLRSFNASRKLKAAMQTVLISTKMLRNCHSRVSNINTFADDATAATITEGSDSGDDDNTATCVTTGDSASNYDGVAYHTVKKPPTAM